MHSSASGQPTDTSKRTFLVTGAAGFIGSHLVGALLEKGYQVVGVDDLSTGQMENLREVQNQVAADKWQAFRFVEGDIRDRVLCKEVCSQIYTVIHLAAIASVPASIENPEATHAVNVDGFLNVLLSARESGVARMVFASSSAVYGDSSEMPAREERLGKLLSPYAATKRIGEIYGQTFASDQFQFVALRFFNVFGPRQPLRGPYAAVIPLWIQALLSDEPAILYGDGTSTRSFCYVEDVVEACMQASTAPLKSCFEVFNVAGNTPTRLNELFETLRQVVAQHKPLAATQPDYRAFRAGDILHSSASIDKIQSTLGFLPKTSLKEGLQCTVDFWVPRMKDAT